MISHCSFNLHFSGIFKLLISYSFLGIFSIIILDLYQIIHVSLFFVKAQRFTLFLWYSLVSMVIFNTSVLQQLSVYLKTQSNLPGFTY